MKTYLIQAICIVAFSLPIYVIAAPALACTYEPNGFRPPEDQRVEGWSYGRENRPPNRTDVKFSYYAYILADENAAGEKYFIEHVFCNMHDTQRISFRWDPIDYAYNRFPPTRCDCARSQISYPLDRIERAVSSHIQFLNTAPENREAAHAIKVSEQDGSPLASLFRTIVSVWTGEYDDTVRQEVTIESRWKDDTISLSLEGDVQGLEFALGPAAKLIQDSEPAMAAVSKAVTNRLLTETPLASYSKDFDFVPMSLREANVLVFSPADDGILFSYKSREPVAQTVTMSVFNKERDFILSRRIRVHASPPQ